MGKKHSRKFLATVERSRSIVQECDITQFSSMLNDGNELIVIDVRERHEYEAGCFEGALHLSKGVIERDIEKHPIADDARIVLYCGGGYRSALAAESLTRMGYSDVYSLWGGWRCLVAEGLAKSIE
ncbi:MAG: rhodanese-like domain-containing protein [Candidatus Poseidoniaceae archaeon]|jgi:rhodanese-related sulfurtransferase|nr:rhodanese-like domain-containing protein [Candidatus Poseidoniaceae archaeon]